MRSHVWVLRVRVRVRVRVAWISDWSMDSVQYHSQSTTVVLLLVQYK